MLSNKIPFIIIQHSRDVSYSKLINFFSFSLISLTDFISPCIQILLRNRATDLEARMDDGTTPLVLAARHDLPDLVRHLIKAGVKVNSADNQGEFLTPIFRF